MRGVVIHAAKDLRVEDVAGQPLAADEVRVAVAVGGICGSDLHYYNHGGFGTVRVREPMALGHEFAGTVVEVGSSVSHLVPGMRVAVNPEPALRHLPLLRSGQAESVPGHALHGQRHALPMFRAVSVKS